MWLRWRAKSSSSAGTWAWKHFEGPIRGCEPGEARTKGLELIIRPETRDAVESFLEEMANYHCVSEQSRGIEYDVFDTGYAPTWVIEKQLEALTAGMNARQAQFARDLQALTIEQTRSRGCPQCEHAHVGPKGNGYIRPCPRCGRSIDVGSMPFWILPQDMPGWDLAEGDAFDLLDSLCQHPRKSKNRGADLIKRVEMPAMQILVDRGLAGQSSGPDGAEAYASEKGKDEWRKHLTLPKLQAPKPKAKTKGRKRK